MQRILINALFIAVISFGESGTTVASIIDDDFWCRVSGCVMISDGFGADVYDVHQFAGGGDVPVGSPLVPWTGNPIQGIGPVNIIETGTTTAVPTTLPPVGNGTRLAIDSNGNGTGDIAINDNNNNGYIDASDSLNAFSISGSTDVAYQANTIPHSFYLTSRATAFDMRARSFVNSATADYGASVALSDIGFGISTTQAGNDAGVAFGALANNGGFAPIAGINDLGDIAGAYTIIALFNNANGIRRNPDNANNHVHRQSLRFNMNYAYPVLDLSQGDGSIQFRVEYAPYRR